MKYANGLMLAAGLTIGNFVWSALSGKRDWDIAFERSYFQTAAILIYIFTQG